MDEIISKLKGAKKQGNGYIACCPAHDDRTPSLSITESNGKTLVHCHAGCKQEDVIRELKNLGAWPEQKKTKPKLVAEYNYTDADGVLLYQAVRMEPKSFRYRQPKPGGAWQWNLKSVSLVPYNLPAVLSAERGVIIVEGEKDADRLIELGITATTAPMGAGKWRKQYSKHFEGKTVYIIPDNDDPGRDHAEHIAESVQPYATEVKIVTVPGPDKSDVSDWLNNGGDKQKLIKLIKDAPKFKKKTPAVEPSASTQPLVENTSTSRNLESRAAPSFVEWPDAKDNGTPLNTIRNLEHLLSLYEVTVKYNVISKSLIVNIPGKTFSVDNADECALAEIMSMCGKHRMPTGAIPQYLVNICDKNPINPAKAWIESKPWDGTDYIQQLTESLNPRAPRLARLFLERWMVSAVAGAYEPNGVAAQGVLVLQGKQGAGKTSWFDQLLNKNDDLFKEGALLDPTDRDSVKQCVQRWVVELGELEATLKRTDQSLRAFLTKRNDEFRKPYARTDSKFPRRTVFCGTVNEFQYLRDPEGNRRFWTIVCDGYLEAHSIDVQQAWAQAYDIYQERPVWSLTRAETDELNEYNKDFEAADPITEKIQSMFDFNVNRNTSMTATEVLEVCGYERPTKANVREASSILRKLTGTEPVRRSNGRFFKMPEPKIRGYH